MEDLLVRYADVMLAEKELLESRFQLYQRVSDVEQLRRQCIKMLLLGHFVVILGYCPLNDSKRNSSSYSLFFLTLVLYTELVLELIDRLRLVLITLIFNVSIIVANLFSRLFRTSRFTRFEGKAPMVNVSFLEGYFPLLISYLQIRSVCGQSHTVIAFAGRVNWTVSSYRKVHRHGSFPGHDDVFSANVLAGLKVLCEAELVTRTQIKLNCFHLQERTEDAQGEKGNGKGPCHRPKTPISGSSVLSFIPFPPS
mmetsp:Transcript_26551/g.103403  ORF Transcript_26551/g.103403 Transcript_26551/m.103403 type:complete len:253 (+) Transcript_26551:729-1487(+)